MEYTVTLQLDILTPDDVLKEYDLTYYSVERMIDIGYVPFPNLWIRIAPIIEDDDRSIEKYRSLFQSVTHKTGIFEVERPIVDIANDGSVNHVIKLLPKMENSFESFEAMKEFIEYFGFKPR